MTPPMRAIHLTVIHDRPSMAIFSLPPTLRKVHCMTNGQLTPPPSPDTPACSSVRLKGTSNSQIPRLARSRPHSQTVKKNSPDVEVTSHEQHRTSAGTLSNTWQHHDEPVLTTQSLTFQSPRQTIERTDEACSPTSIPSLGLRRVTRIYDNLRGAALEHEKELYLTLPITSPIHTPLLPSPVIDDRRMMADETALSYFRFDNPRPLVHRRTDSNYKSYEDMQILSCYEDTYSDALEETAPCSIRGENLLDAISTSPHGSVRDMDSVDYERQLSLQSSASAESDWLANTTSHRQRLRKFRARCCQVVQHPLTTDTLDDEEEGKVMLATVLVGPGKPRLVQIQRSPSSTNLSLSSRSPSNKSAHSVQSQEETARVPPSTPVRPCREVSAFSPYDTPSISTPLNIRPSQNFTGVSVHRTPLTASKLELVPQPLSISQNTSSSCEQTTRDSAERGILVLQRHTPLSPSMKNYAVMSTNAARNLPSNTYTKPKPVTDDKHEQWRRNLNAIALAIEDFPSRALDLECPSVLQLRNSPTENKTQIHLANVLQVFPNTPREVLSMLAAWVIVDWYVSKLQSDRGNFDSQIFNLISTVTSPLKKLSIPKRSASLGVPIAHPPKLHRRPTAYYKLFPSPPKKSATTSNAAAILMKKNKKMNKSKSEISLPRSSQSLQDIPGKARLVLGIDDNEAHVSEEQMLLTQAKALSLSIGVIAQRLIEALRGEKGRDPYLWRALVVVVASVEEAAE